MLGPVKNRAGKCVLSDLKRPPPARTDTNGSILTSDATSRGIFTGFFASRKNLCRAPIVPGQNASGITKPVARPNPTQTDVGVIEPLDFIAATCAGSQAGRAGRYLVHRAGMLVNQLVGSLPYRRQVRQYGRRRLSWALSPSAQWAAGAARISAVGPVGAVPTSASDNKSARPYCYLFCKNGSASGPARGRSPANLIKPIRLMAGLNWIGGTALLWWGGMSRGEPTRRAAPMRRMPSPRRHGGKCVGAIARLENRIGIRPV